VLVGAREVRGVASWAGASDGQSGGRAAAWCSRKWSSSVCMCGASGAQVVTELRRGARWAGEWKPRARGTRARRARRNWWQAAAVVWRLGGLLLGALAQAQACRARGSSGPGVRVRLLRALTLAFCGSWSGARRWSGAAIGEQGGGEAERARRGRELGEARSRRRQLDRGEAALTMGQL
jgi:hypothetical protein